MTPKPMKLKPLLMKKLAMKMMKAKPEHLQQLKRVHSTMKSIMK